MKHSKIQILQFPITLLRFRMKLYCASPKAKLNTPRYIWKISGGVSNIVKLIGMFVFK